MTTKFDMGEAWREATTMISANREVLLIVAGIFFFLPALLASIVMPDFTTLLMGNSDPEAMESAIYAFYADYGWLFALTTLVQIVGSLAMLALLRDAARPTVAEAIKTGFVGLLPTIGLYLILAIGLGVVFAAGGAIAVASGSTAIGVVLVLIAFIALIYVWVKLSMTPAVIAIEKVLNPFTVIARSWKLTKGNSVRLFLFYLLLVIVYFVVSMIVGIVVAALLFALGPDVGMVANGVVSGLLGALMSVLFVGVIASIHRQLSGPSDEAMSRTFE